MKFVMLGDTHGFHPEIPPGDVLIHTGDFTRGWGGRDHVKDVARWLGEQPHPHKFMVGGNHDGSLFTHEEQCRSILGIKGIRYLCHQAAMVEDLKIWGSPYHPQIAGVFGKSYEELFKIWAEVDDPDVDVLITHGPPYDMLDQTIDGEHAGDKWLRNWLNGRRPKLHAFGHIHEGYGSFKGTFTHFFNVSICNERYEPINPVTEVDI